MNPKDNYNYEFNVLENGLDFLIDGLNHILKEGNYNSIKYAVLHISSGIELIFKSRLMQEHWSLVFADIDKATKNEFLSGDFKSVEFNKLIHRIENVCEIQIHQSEKLNLLAFKNMRNSIEHFHVKQNYEAMKSECSRVLSMVLNFIINNFEVIGLSNTAKIYIDELREMAIRFNQFVDLRLAQLKNELDSHIKENMVDMCPKCTQATFILGEKLHCLFCGYKDSPQNVALLYSDIFLDNSGLIEERCPVIDCIDCGHLKCMVIREDDFICYNCYVSGQNQLLAKCHGCGIFYRRYEIPVNLCRPCFEGLFPKA